MKIQTTGKSKAAITRVEGRVNGSKDRDVLYGGCSRTDYKEESVIFFTDEEYYFDIIVNDDDLANMKKLIDGMVEARSKLTSGPTPPVKFTFKVID